MIVTLIIFLLILSVLVLIHEAGHYFVAKKFGMKVEEFGFGFPLTPPLWQMKKGETVYSFYPVLIGGFVKLYGEDEAGAGRIDVGKKKAAAHPKDEDRAFYARPFGQKFLVVVAGVVMNALLAALIYYVFLGMSGWKQDLPLIGNPTFVGVNEKVTTQVVISEISKNSPAAAAGIAPFSTVETINGQKIAQADAFEKAIKANIGTPMTLAWKDEKNVQHHATIVPRVHPPKNEGALGVAFYPNRTVSLAYATPTQKLFSGFVHPANLMGYNFVILGDLINISIKEKSVNPIKPAVSGPVGIGFVVGSLVSIPDSRERFLALLNLAGLLSISLAFMNVLPIPGLDGGRLFFIIIEAVIRRKINPKVEGYIHAAGMVVLLLLIALVTVNDVQTHSQDILSYFGKLFR